MTNNFRRRPTLAPFAQVLQLRLSVSDPSRATASRGHQMPTHQIGKDEVLFPDSKERCATELRSRVHLNDLTGADTFERAADLEPGNREMPPASAQGEASEYDRGSCDVGTRSLDAAGKGKNCRPRGAVLAEED